MVDDEKRLRILALDCYNRHNRVRNCQRGRRGIMKILISTFVALAMLALALPAFAQEVVAPVETTPAAPAAAGCDWYWWSKFNPAGSWEYWCWDPQLGWWYAESEDGKRKSITYNRSS